MKIFAGILGAALLASCTAALAPVDRERAALAVVAERCGSCHGMTAGERCLAGNCAERAHALEPRPWDLVLEWMESIGCGLPTSEKARLSAYLMDRYPRTYPVHWQRLDAVPEGWNVVALASYRGRLYAGIEGAGQVVRLDGRRWRPVLTTGAYTVYGLVSFQGRMFAATNQTVAAVWSSEEGTAWTRETVLSDEKGVTSLGRFRDGLYAGTTRGGLYRTFDGGTWEFAGTPLPGADGRFTNWVRFVTEFRGALYAGIEGEGLFKSPDGLVWESVALRPGTGVRAAAVIGEAFYVGTTSGGEVWRTADGERWERVFEAPALGGRRGYVASIAAAGGMIYAGIDGRVYRTVEGREWEEAGHLTPFTIEALHEFGGSLYAGTALPSRAWVYRARP